MEKTKALPGAPGETPGRREIRETGGPGGCLALVVWRAADSSRVTGQPSDRHVGREVSRVDRDSALPRLGVLLGRRVSINFALKFFRLVQRPGLKRSHPDNREVSLGGRARVYS
jgi:hypothetical protein